MSYTPKNLGHVVMRVRDMDRSLDFYTQVMGLTIRAIGIDANGPDHSVIGQAHMAWQMESFEDLQELYFRLKENDVRIIRIGDHGVSLGVYILDPDDNEIEVYYELPKSDWKSPEGKGLFGGNFPKQLIEVANVAGD